MRFLLQTDYEPDIRLFRFGGERRLAVLVAIYAGLLVALHALEGRGEPWSTGVWAGIGAGYAAVVALGLVRPGRGALWYGLLAVAVLTAPRVLGVYYVSQLTFVYVYGIAGAGLLLLAGFTGQISLGHAAFMACGGYTAAILQAQGMGIAISFPAAVVLSALLGVAIGLPALRMTGIYLAFATFAFAFLVEEVLVRWESLTHGNLGMLLDPPALGPLVFEGETRMYYLALACLAATLLAGLNLLRSPTGRAWRAIRDSEIAAESIGVHLPTFKTAAFAISAGLTGLAGALYAHLLVFISPEGFTVQLSIQLVAMILVGGLGSLHGAVFGAAFLVVLPEIIAVAREHLPPAIGEQTGLETAVFGLVVVGFVLFEPLGIHGRWLKIKTYLDQFPLYREGTFRRQRSYTVSERVR